MTKKLVLNFHGEKGNDFPEIYGDVINEYEEPNKRVIKLNVTGCRYFGNQKPSDATKSDIEFSRYKQDCRKRALELAHQQINAPEFRNFFESNNFLHATPGIPPIQTPLKEKPIVKEEILISLADKYYKWLISIPNE